MAIITDDSWLVKLYTREDRGWWTLHSIFNEYQSFTFHKVINDSGNGGITFHFHSLTSSQLSALNGLCLIAFCKRPKLEFGAVNLGYGTDIAFAILPEHYDLRYSGARDHVLTISGPGIGRGMDFGVTFPFGYNGSNSPSNRPISALRPLDVWVDLINEANVRFINANQNGFGFPYLSPVDYKTVDYKGIAWDSNLNINATFEIKSGTGLFELLKWAQGFGGFDFSVEFSGQSPLNVWVIISQSPRNDVSNKVGFHQGRHHLEGSQVLSREGIISDIHVNYTSGGLGSWTNSINNATAFRYARREFWWEDGAQYTFEEATKMANTLNTLRSVPSSTITFDIVPNLDHRAFIDYDVMDTVFYGNPLLFPDAKTENVKVVGIAVRVEGDDERQSVMLETPSDTFHKRAFEHMQRQEYWFKYNARMLSQRKL
jgi:hypothetical protein